MKVNFSKKLQELRKKHNLSQELLAEKIEVSRQTVSKWECDEALPDLANLICLAKLFGISLDALVGINTADNADDLPDNPKLQSFIQKADEQTVDLIKKILQLLHSEGKISLSKIQRNFGVGFHRAGMIVDLLLQFDIIQQGDGNYYIVK